MSQRALLVIGLALVAAGILVGGVIGPVLGDQVAARTPASAAEPQAPGRHLMPLHPGGPGGMFPGRRPGRHFPGGQPAPSPSASPNL